MGGTWYQSGWSPFVLGLRARTVTLASSSLRRKTGRRTHSCNQVSICCLTAGSVRPILKQESQTK